MAAAVLSVLERNFEPDADVLHAHALRPDDENRPQHIRPRILRRGTSQILSYYQSADAGRWEVDPEYRYPTPRPAAVARQFRVNGTQRRSRSSSDSNYSGEDTESVSDYGEVGSPEVEGNRAWDWIRNGDKIQDGNTNIEDSDGAGGESNTESDIQYGIALGSPSAEPGEDALLLTLATDTDMDRDGIDSGSFINTNGNSNSNTDTSTDVGSGYGSRITDQFQLSPRPTHSRPQLNLPLTAFHLSLPATGQVQSARVHTQPEPPLTLAASTTVDSVLSEAQNEPDAAPGRRRTRSSRGASDKRRVAIVQMDSETEGEQTLVGEDDVDGRRTLSDGFGRVEAAGRPYMAQGPHQQQQQQQQFFQVQPYSSSLSTTSSPSAFASSTKSSAASALLARRGIVGTFALVAPADASPSAYTNLGYFTPPPLSAPASAHSTPPLLARHESAESTTSTAYSNTSESSYRRQHQRSQSEAVLTSAHGAITRFIPKAVADANLGERSSKEEKRSRPGHRWRKSSRDIGIVGTSVQISPTSGTMMMDVQLRHDEIKTRTNVSSDRDSSHKAQVSPIFQTPSRSQISLVSSDDASSVATSDPHAQSSSMYYTEPKRRSQQPASGVNAMSNGNVSETGATGAAHRSPRDENISHVDPRQAWHAHAPSLSSTPVYSSFYTSNGASSPSYSYYTMATTASSPSISSPPTVFAMPAPAPSPYLYYQPGIHATAGPLPSPPRQIIPPKHNSPPPPRPPRLHAPNSGSSSLAKRRSETSITSKQEKPLAPTSSPAVRQPEVMSPAMTPSTTSSTLVNSQSEDSVKSKAGHTREGAFPINSVIITDATQKTQSRLSVKQEQQQVLKRKNTMDDLVRDVTAAIDEAVSGTAQKPNPTPAESSPLPAQKNEQVLPKEQSVGEARSGMDLRREESRSTFKGEEPQSPASPSSTYSDDECDKVGDITITRPLPDPLSPSLQPSPRSESQESGTGDSSSSKPRKILDFALKRFSTLPRPPSTLSATRVSPRSSNSHERNSQDRSENDHGHGSGLGHEQLRTPPRTRIVYVAKIRSTWPAAMQFGDVLAKRTSLERSLGYARKINELANYDPGLGDWVVTTKHNLTVPGKSSKRKSLSPAVRTPSEPAFSFQPRHPSRGSMGSEMTFPKRVDSYVSTDLLPQRSEDETLPRGPPPLPYPTLAHGVPSQQQQQPARLGVSSSTRSNASSLGSSKSTGGGFFASIGRKASVKKDRPALQGAASTQPNKLLSKRQQNAPAPAPRPVQISAAPSLPGGPRAPPGRVQRAQSVIAPKMPAPAESESESARRRSIKRSPSVAPSLARSEPNAGTDSSSDIDTKVAKLADLLPHADKKVLAGYLRRAGGMDMVAIGRYLDDEKNRRLIRE